jgi:prolipoprotein diacylglyceryl transferase
MISIRPPESLVLGPVHIYTYSLCILAGIVGGYYLCREAGRRAGLSADALQLSLLYGVIPGVIGARLYHVLDQHVYYLANPTEIIAIWHGGLGIIGGLAGGVFGLWWFARQRRIRLLTVLDIWAPGVLLAQAVGRIGNWANQEAFGPPSQAPWAIPIDPIKRPTDALGSPTFHPTFLYELTWDLVGLVVLLVFRRRLELTPGRTLGAYLMIYGSGRFLAEYFRFETAELAGVPVAQVVAVALVTLGAYLLLRSATPPATASVKSSPRSRAGTASRR